MYREAIPKLMKEAGFLVISEEFGEMEDPDPDKHRERQIALYEEIEDAKKLVAQEEAEALRLGKKVKRRTRKSGFLGLWGKEIQSIPADFEIDRRRSSLMTTGEYDPSEDSKVVGNGDLVRKSDISNSTRGTQGGNTVLFDVDKMREELASNGVTMTSLESTMPPLVLSRPLEAPPMHRASTNPVVNHIQRTHSPSLPIMSRNNASTGDVDKSFDIKPRDITPQRPLEKLILEPRRPLKEWSLSPPKTNWESETGGGITMSFEPDSPQAPRPSTFTTEPSLGQSYRPPSRSLERIEVKPVASIPSMPIEKNVWDDDDYGSSGNITMTFE
jgi:hypothetical protein